jgi:hypothetical protein
MKVDSKIEPLVREAFAACVGQEPKRFANAVVAITDRGDRVTVDALTLATSIDAYALMALHHGKAPDQQQLEYLSTQFAATEAWAKVPAANARELISALAENRTSTLGAGDLAEATFTVGAWLLSAFLPEDKDWTDFLDEILNAIDAAPSQ